MFKKLTGFALVAGLFIAGTASAQIVGSPHDFSGETWNPGGEICIVCHTTHNSITTVSEAPLWNHDLTGATFIPYDTPTLDATVGQPGAVSLLCLSCHDGTVALDSFGGNTGSTNIGGAENVGTDLTDDHPVGLTYDAALATTDGELANPVTTASGLGGNINVDMLFGAGNDQLECGSCHDVHGNGLAFLLLKSNAASALCLTCHSK